MIAFYSTLSMTLNHGLNFLLVMFLIWVLNASIIVSYFVSFIGFSKIAFVIKLYRMKIAMYLSMLLMGEFPIFLMYIIPSFLSIVAMYVKSDSVSLFLQVVWFIVRFQQHSIFISVYLALFWYPSVVVSHVIYLLMVNYLVDTFYHRCSKAWRRY